MSCFKGKARSLNKLQSTRILLSSWVCLSLTHVCQLLKMTHFFLESCLGKALLLGALMVGLLYFQGNAAKPPSPRVLLLFSCRFLQEDREEKEL